ncbi:hypothetical protein NHX12_023428 [Muraenolepis orangiensis]|uniref:Distal membrane-arm assembly complex protein 1-like domain-containing protein n=1 Tax=Muraenolepis orangiensis TaxID=630683 RepID=A0A9Q0ENN9_9TELE|nr:hypothetical protein NHX12_023428 [Muraenolepis orangiensis]
MATTAPTADRPTVGERVKSCWSCRLLSGGALMASGGYVFQAARRTLSLGGPPTIGLTLQITFAACLAAWGAVVVADPVGKVTRKSPTD